MSSKDRVTRVELEQRLDAMETKVNDIKVLAAELEGTRRRQLSEDVEKLKPVVKKLEEFAAGASAELHRLIQRVDTMVRTVKELVTANNSASIVVNCVETHLDETAPGWDKGVREQTERRAALLRERAEIAARAQRRSREDEDRDGRRADAARLWEISRELGSEGTDVPLVLSLYLQARDPDAALAFVAEVKDAGLAVDGDLADVMRQLTARIEELRADIAAPSRRCGRSRRGDPSRTRPRTEGIVVGRGDLGR
jgi:hypothetical protein